MILPFFSLVTVVQIQDFSVCAMSYTTGYLGTFPTTIPRIILSAILFILALIPSFKESVGMYKVTKQWQLNRYMKLLARDGIIYFLVYVFLLSFLPISHTHYTFQSSSAQTIGSLHFPLN